MANSEGAEAGELVRTMVVEIRHGEKLSLRRDRELISKVPLIGVTDDDVRCLPIPAPMACLPRRLLPSRACPAPDRKTVKRSSGFRSRVLTSLCSAQAILTGMIKAGSSTALGFGAVQLVQNVTVPHGNCWLD